MAFVTAYFDESYASPNPSVFTVAGYISTDRRWVKFQKAWAALLRQEVLARWREVYGLDKKIFFHMTDFDNPHSKIYGQWPQKKKIWFLKELHKVIQKAYLRSFSSGVITADYNKLSHEEKYAVGSPYLCAAGNCVKQVAAWAARENRQHPILYVFEQGVEDVHHLCKMLNSVSGDVREFYRLEKCVSGDKRRLWPLQAADVLALETRKEVQRRFTIKNERKMRESIKNLGIEHLDEWAYLDEFQLRNIFKDVRLRDRMNSDEFKRAVATTRWKPKV